MDNNAKVLMEKTMSMMNLIGSDPDIRNGEMIITGTRIPVIQVRALFEDGATCQELQEDYDLSYDQIVAALSYTTAMGITVIKKSRKDLPWINLKKI